MLRLFLLVFYFWSSTLFAQQGVVTLRSTVKGNQEQPKVLYVVPWQRDGKTTFVYEPSPTYLQEIFRSVDRDEFLRELEFESSSSRRE